MASVAVMAQKASRSEVLHHRQAIRNLIAAAGLTDPRLRDDGTIVVHTAEPGYHAVGRLSRMASDVVGRYVHVITDDVPGAAGSQEF
jgi:hypothetical protein